MAFDDGWEEINVPRGAFIGWGDRPGQHVTGEVLDYSNDGGTDFDGRSCPQLSVILTEEAHSHSKENGWTKFDAGELVVLNCGQASLKRAVQSALLKPGDLTKITFTGIENLKGGKTVKVFGIKVKRGSGQLSNNAERAVAAAGSATQQQAGPSFNGGPAQQNDPWNAPPQRPDDPWGAAPQQPAFSGAGDDEPPF